MIKKLIFIEGMSGSGKSTLSQYLCLQLKEKGIDTEWFHEQESSHPLYREEYDKFLKNRKYDQFKSIVLKKWFDYIEKNNNGIKIFEAQIQLSIIANLLWNGFSERYITNILEEIIALINKNINNNYIYLYASDPKLILNNTIEQRGGEWGDWYLEYFGNSTFSKTTNKKGITGIDCLWRKVNDIGDNLYQEIRCRKYRIDVSMSNWMNHYEKISDYFDYGFTSIERSLSNKERFFGEYRLGNQKIVVYLREDKLYCDFGWPRIEMIPKNGKNEFYLKSFPHELRFVEKNNTISEIEIIGKDIAGLRGKIYTKIKK